MDNVAATASAGDNTKHEDQPGKAMPVQSKISLLNVLDCSGEGISEPIFL